jgi:hypothetical protein
MLNDSAFCDTLDLVIEEMSYTVAEDTGALMCFCFNSEAFSAE